MIKYMVAAAVISAAGIFGLACQEEPVGAPCVPETDKGEYNSDLQGKVYGIETRSVQCEAGITGTCLTLTRKDGKDKQVKHSFCSCRCRDADGHTFKENPDKYWDLCECPPDTLCKSVLENLESAPKKIQGSYCLPKCIDQGCPRTNQECTPSSDSSEPWKWKCR